MNQEEYLKDRLEDQIDWHDKKSVANQKWFKRLQLVAIVGAASIPFLSGLSPEATPLFFRVAAGGLGLLVAAVTAILGLYKFQENWLQYRTTCESLQQEKYLFLTKSAPYDVNEPFNLLVQRVETLLSAQNASWAAYTRSQPTEEQ